MKNIRLKLKDLFDGRIVYLAEPGVVPVKVTVKGRVDSVLRYETLGLDTSGRDHLDILKQHNGHYTIVPESSIRAIAQRVGREMPPEGSIGLCVKYVSPTQSVVVMDGNGDFHTLQDILLDPAESRLKVFAKEKQADRYSNFPAKFGEGLETIFPTEE